MWYKQLFVLRIRDKCLGIVNGYLVYMMQYKLWNSKIILLISINTGTPNTITLVTGYPMAVNKRESLLLATIILAWYIQMEHLQFTWNSTLLVVSEYKWITRFRCCNKIWIPNVKIWLNICLNGILDLDHYKTDVYHSKHYFAVIQSMITLAWSKCIHQHYNRSKNWW